MIPLKQLLITANKPHAATHLETLIAKHDVWIVGGAARHCLSDGLTPFPHDIDLLVNTDVKDEARCVIDYEPAGASVPDEGPSGTGQKYVFAGVHFDVFCGSLTGWLRGAPCFGDQLAIRAADEFVLCTPDFFKRPFYDQNLSWNPADHPTGLVYFKQHAQSVARDYGCMRTFLNND